MEELRAALKQFPSSFDVADDIRIVSDNYKIKVKNKLLNELCSLLGEFSTCMEKVRVWNLLSFLYFVLGDRKNAVKYNCQVLQESPDNIIALANGAWFSFKEKKNVNVCEQTLKRLRSIKGNKLAFLVAKAEIAFTYSRFGIKQYANAVVLFRQIAEEIGKCKFKTKISSRFSSDIDGIKKYDIPVEFKCIWIFGFAMTLQRLLNVNGMDDEDDAEDFRKRHLVVFELYTQIVELIGKSECIRRYQARAYVEAGLLAYGVNKNTFLFPEGLKGLLKSKSPILMPAERFFETALQIFPNDVFVLERSGRYCRYINDLERSILLLSRAVEIKGTSFGYHHLALSYIRLLEYNPKKISHLLEILDQRNEPESSSIFTCASPVIERGEHVPSRHTHSDNVESGILNPEAKSFIPKRDTPHSCSSQPIGAQAKQNDRNKCAYNTFRIYFPERAVKVSDQKNNQYRIEKVQGNSVSVHQGIRAQRSYGTEVGCYNETAIRTANSSRRYTQKAKKKKSQNTTYGSRLQNARPNTGSVVKCPYKPKHIDYEKHKDVVETILFHLDTSLRLSSNMVALYDKALLFRQIQQYHKALDCIETLMQNSDDLCSSVMLANAYEQAALCINDMLENNETKDEHKTEDMIKDRDFYLKSSIEMSCKVVDRHPYLGNCWKSPTTLRHILLSKLKLNRTKEILKDLWQLYEKINNHLEAIDVLKELQGLSEDDGEKDEINEEIVRRYLYLHRYEEAVIALCMFSRLDNGVPQIDRNLSIQVYTEAGLEAFKQKHFEKANWRIRKALDFPKIGLIAGASTNDDAKERYDLFILSDLEDADQRRNLMELLNSIGLFTTYNADSSSILPGTPEVQGMTSVMNVSNAFVILMNFDTENKQMQYIIDRMEIIVGNRNEESIIIVLTKSSTKLSPTCGLASFRQISLDIDSISETCLEKDDMFEQMKRLLLALALT